MVCVLGYYYELDDSYDESDEEEVKAHLRRVTEQPPLKLDQSKEVPLPLLSPHILLLPLPSPAQVWYLSLSLSACRN